MSALRISIIVAFLLFVEILNVEGGAIEKRSLVDLRDMVQKTTGRNAMDFVGYGHWCGFGGSGVPLDPIDECCQTHDYCYNQAADSTCEGHPFKEVYTTEYSYKIRTTGKIHCDKSEDECKDSLCLCDSVLVECIRSNMKFYNPSNRKALDVDEMIKGVLMTARK